MGVKRSTNQRDMMRSIFARYRGNRGRVVAEYAAAEGRGEVARKSNTTEMTAEEYANALLSDGLRKGWLQS